MTFRITRDLLAEQDPSEGSFVGNSYDQMPQYGLERAAGLDDRLPFYTEGNRMELPTVTFRLKDDDGEVYFEGELHDDPELMNQSAALRWGEAGAGCTTIEVRRLGKWEQEIG